MALQRQPKEFCILMLTVVKPTYTQQKTTQSHIHCTNTILLILTSHLIFSDKSHSDVILTLTTFCTSILPKKKKILREKKLSCDYLHCCGIFPDLPTTLCLHVDRFLFLSVSGAHLFDNGLGNGPFRWTFSLLFHHSVF